jgi:hypothetical protein
MSNVLDLKVIKNRKKIKEQRKVLRQHKSDMIRISKSLKESVPEVPTTIDGFCLVYFRHGAPGQVPDYGISYDFRDFRDFAAFPHIFQHFWAEAHTSGGS